MTTQLSPNFTLGEFAVSASHPDLVVPVPAQYIPNARRLARKVLQPIRDGWQKPIKITSSYRSEQLNNAVGGSLTSQHRRAEAADITTSGVRALFFALLAAGGKGLEIGQVIWYPKDNFIHVALPSVRYPIATFFVSVGKKAYRKVTTRAAAEAAGA